MVALKGKRLKKIMCDQRLTVSVAESLTTGNIQAMIGATSGASNFYRGGVTAYDIDQKVKHLNVDRAHAKKVNCVSQRVAIEMAKGVSWSFMCDIGVGTTGYAETSAEQKVSEPYAYFGIWRWNKKTSKGTVVAKGRVKGKRRNRVKMQQHVAEVTLNALLEYLEEHYQTR
jgi:nicotinamide-nucleotide amidase